MASTKSIARRIAKLEALFEGPEPEYRRGWKWRSHRDWQPSVRVRYGNLRRLPEDYHGERHTVIAQYLPERNGQEWVEFVEVPGPDPNPEPASRGHLTCIDVAFIEPYPSQLNEP